MSLCCSRKKKKDKRLILWSVWLKKLIHNQSPAISPTCIQTRDEIIWNFIKTIIVTKILMIINIIGSKNQKVLIHIHLWSHTAQHVMVEGEWVDSPCIRVTVANLLTGYRFIPDSDLVFLILQGSMQSIPLLDSPSNVTAEGWDWKGAAERWNCLVWPLLHTCCICSTLCKNYISQNMN